jgi:putative ABC transport system permease protein
MPTASVKVSPDNLPATIEYIIEAIKSFFPGWAEENFEFTSLEDTWNRQYERDERTAGIIRNFAILAILIACLGLFGLSSFMAARRIKEIGIRKTLGASNISLFLLLSSEYIKWVVLSYLIASPLSWYIMNRWLHSFAYRTSIDWWIFAATIGIALAITFLTITWHTLKTARTNPVEALRYE